MSTTWDRRFLSMARLVATWSKDPSTRCGCVITDAKHRVVSLGFNGFARGVRDHPERYSDRDVKYRLVLHAEMNAVLFSRRDLTGCTLYNVPMLPCARCAAVIIQAGISRVVSPPLPEHLTERWGEEVRLSLEQFKDAEVYCIQMDD